MNKKVAEIALITVFIFMAVASLRELLLWPSNAPC